MAIMEHPVRQLLLLITRRALCGWHVPALSELPAKLVDSDLCPACGVTDSVSHICTTCQRDGLQERRNIWAGRVRDVVSEYINCNDLRDDLQTLITSSADYLPGGNPSTTWKSTGRTASLLSQVAKAGPWALRCALLPTTWEMLLNNWRVNDKEKRNK